jgi:hypothetical protein
VRQECTLCGGVSDWRGLGKDARNGRGFRCARRQGDDLTGSRQHAERKREARHMRLNVGRSGNPIGHWSIGEGKRRAWENAQTVSIATNSDQHQVKDWEPFGGMRNPYRSQLGKVGLYCSVGARL